VDERGETQPPPLFGRRRLAVDVLEYICDVVFHGALAMAAACLAPLDTLLPLGLGGDPAFEIRLQLERQAHSGLGSRSRRPASLIRPPSGYVRLIRLNASLRTTTTEGEAWRSLRVSLSAK
jgi:hypothetical protein